MQAWFLGLISHWSVKAILVIFFIGLFIGSYFLTYNIANGNGYSKGYAQSLKDNPPNVYEGTTTVNQQPCSAPNVYGLSLGKLGLGIIFKK